MTGLVNAWNMLKVCACAVNAMQLMEANTNAGRFKFVLFDYRSIDRHCPVSRISCDFAVNPLCSRPKLNNAIGKTI